MAALLNFFVSDINDSHRKCFYIPSNLSLEIQTEKLEVCAGNDRKEFDLVGNSTYDSLFE